MLWRTLAANVLADATSLRLGLCAGSTSTVTKLTNCVSSRTMCHSSLQIVQAGLSRRHWYEMHTGNTGAAGANAPLRNLSSCRPVVVMPSGAMATIGHAGSFSLHAHVPTEFYVCDCRTQSLVLHLTSQSWDTRRLTQHTPLHSFEVSAGGH